MSCVTVRLSPLVDADGIRRLVETYADRGYDFVLRAGCPPEQAVGVLLAAVEHVLADPAGAPDPLGAWLHAATTITAGMTGGRAGPPADGDGVGARIGAALDSLDPTSARILLLRDTYDLPASSVAVAIGLELGDLRRRTGSARLAFVHHYDPGATRLLQDLPTCAANQGELAALSDATSPPGLSAEFRGHAYRCQRCEETTEIHRRARWMLSRVTLRPMDRAARTAVTSAAARLATAGLATARLPAAGASRGRGLPPARHLPAHRRPGRRVVAAALSAALAGGVVVGLTDLGSRDGPPRGTAGPASR